MLCIPTGAIEVKGHKTKSLSTNEEKYNQSRWQTHVLVERGSLFVVSAGLAGGTAGLQLWIR